MKRKIALLLAVVMTLALLPTNVFASSSVTVYSRGSTSYGHSIYVEKSGQLTNDWVGPGLSTTPLNWQVELQVPQPTEQYPYQSKTWDGKEQFGAYSHDVTGGGGPDIGRGAEWIQNAPEFVITFADGVTTGDQFKVVLSGDGTWLLPILNANLTGTSNSSNSVKNTNSPFRYINLENGQYLNRATVGSALGGINVLGGGTYVRYGSTEIDYTANVKNEITSKVYSTVSSPEGYFNSSGAHVGISVGGTNTNLPEAKTKLGSGREVAYTMAFTGDKEATITILETAPKGSSGVANPIAVVPMLVRVKEKSRVTAQVTVTDFTHTSTGASNSAPIVIVEGVESNTNTTLNPKINNYELFPINTITVNEVRAGSVADKGGFRLEAPSGFEFIFDYNTVANWNYTVGGVSYGTNAPDITKSPYIDAPYSAANPNYSRWLADWMVWFTAKTSGTYGANKYNTPTTATSIAIGGGFKGTPTVSEIYYDVTRNGSVDPTKVHVIWTGLTMSSGTPGVMEFRDMPLLLKAAENAPTGDVKVNIKNEYVFDTNNDGLVNSKDKTSGITDQTLVAGTRKQFGINFTSSGSTTLYNGQYEEDGANDAWHKTASVVFEENLPNSWLSNRQTVFSVPEGVKIVKVYFDEAWRNKIVGEEGGGYAWPMNWSDEKTFWNDGGVRQQVTLTKSNPDAQGTKLAGYMSITDHEITFSGFTENAANNRETTGFRMVLWVTVESGWEGDITLTPSGTGLGAEIVDPVTIAVAKNPVDIKVAEITDIKIGYQQQSTADFDIVENKAGILRRGDTVKLSLTDNVHVTDMSFVDASFDVTDGDLKINNKKVNAYSNTTANSAELKTIGSTGTISFDISAASSKASTISFTDVQVKIDRSIPETNLTPYKIVAWGNAIAPNYDSTSNPDRATHKVPGIMADYLKVATLASGNALNSKVEVPIGSSTILVNGKEVSMDVAAFIDTTNDSTMVPVRFVSTALGIAEESVQWDPNTATATIYSDNRVIQFTIGSDLIIVNGVATPMTAADGSGRPVKAVINGERSFIPFRALGNALGVPVSWDPETQTAIFNP